MKPLFIPLKTEFYEAFERGEKHAEYRLYGPRWNENTCTVGRPVVISHGYGKKRRMSGRVESFRVIHGRNFDETGRKAIRACYGTIDVHIACIEISGLTPIQH